MAGKWRRVSVPTATDDRGVLSYIEVSETIPFVSPRAFYVYDVPLDMTRGEHAHKETEQFFVALDGSVDITLEGATQKSTITLEEPTKGVYVEPLVWVTLTNFSPDCILLVLASTEYDRDEYIEDHSTFRAELRDQE